MSTPKGAYAYSCKGPRRVRLVPEERLELSCPCGRRILSPLRLPVPPFRPGTGWKVYFPRMLVSEFDYELPTELIAQHPVAERSASRLLRLHARTGALEDLRFTDLPGWSSPRTRWS